MCIYSIVEREREGGERDYYKVERVRRERDYIEHACGSMERDLIGGRRMRGMRR